LILFVTLFILWLLLVWSTSQQDMIAGFVTALLIAFVFGSVFLGEPKRVFAPKRWFFFLCYVPYFLYYCVRANLDVAYRVIHPDLPIRPGIVKVRTRLKSDLAKTFLANSITLTPGTLTVDIRGQDLYIHWINVPEDPATWTRQIVGTFEPILAEIFE
jgi:multicomponent Na+:H+ antiporter subunit E